MDLDKDSLIVCRICSVHLIDKRQINPVTGLEMSTSYTLPINVHLTPTKEIITTCSSNNYSFNDIICNKCNCDIGWTIDYPTTYGQKSLVFLLNESIKTL